MKTEQETNLKTIKNGIQALTNYIKMIEDEMIGTDVVKAQSIELYSDKGSRITPDKHTPIDTLVIVGDQFENELTWEKRYFAGIDESTHTTRKFKVWADGATSKTSKSKESVSHWSRCYIIENEHNDSSGYANFKELVDSSGYADFKELIDRRMGEESRYFWEKKEIERVLISVQSAIIDVDNVIKEFEMPKAYTSKWGTIELRRNHAEFVIKCQDTIKSLAKQLINIKNKLG